MNKLILRNKIPVKLNITGSIQLCPLYMEVRDAARDYSNELYNNYTFYLGGQCSVKYLNNQTYLTLDSVEENYYIHLTSKGAFIDIEIPDTQQSYTILPTENGILLPTIKDHYWLLVNDNVNIQVLGLFHL